MGALSGADGESMLAEAKQQGNASSRSRRAGNIKCRATCLTIGVLTLAAIMTLAGPASAGEPRVAVASPFGVQGFDLAVGDRGYAVMVFSVMAGTSTPQNHVSNVFVRTRLPGREDFGPRRFVGKASPGFVGVEIGGDGTTIAVFSAKDGYLRYIERSPGKDWSKRRIVAGARTQSAFISVASDGTVALATLRNEYDSGDPSRVLGAIWVRATAGPRGGGSSAGTPTASASTSMLWLAGEVAVRSYGRVSAAARHRSDQAGFR